MSALSQLQAVAGQAVGFASQIVANVATTVDKLNLGQYTAPLVSSVSKTVGPHFQTASKNLLPILSPYMDLAAPYMGGVKPHLDKISQSEAIFLVGGIFGGVFLLQLVLALTATCRRGASKLKAFTPAVFWLLLCFIIHSWIEYNFVFNRTNNKSGFQNGMNLYGAADFRYGYGKVLDLEAGTAAMEAITALITGPLCLLLAWGIVGNKSWRWTVQIITCTCQMYGLAWFMAHPFFSADKISSDDPFLYWVIFVGFNAPWGIVPPIMLLSAVLHINNTMRTAQNQAQIQAQQAKQQLQQKKTK